MFVNVLNFGEIDLPEFSFIEFEFLPCGHEQNYCLWSISLSFRSCNYLKLCNRCGKIQTERIITSSEVVLPCIALEAWWKQFGIIKYCNETFHY